MVNVNQKSKNFAVRQENHSGRNLFDLSHDHKTTFSMGQLIPFLTLETLPGDKFFINAEIMLRFAPLYLPIMHRVNLSVDYFYIPNRILWIAGFAEQGDGWEAFMTTDNTVAMPYMDINVSAVSSTNSVLEYMGFPTRLVDSGDDITTVRISPFVLSAYLKVWDEYYRNDQIQDKAWLPLVGGNTFNSFANWPGTLGLPIYRNWNRDYFTSGTPTPQVGENVLIPMMRNNTVDEGTWTYLGPTKWKYFDNSAVPSGNDLTTGPGGVTTLNTSDAAKIYLDVQETAATIRDFRFAAMLTEYLERLMRAGDRYRDVLKTFFDVDPMPLTIDRPMFIGGHKGKVVVSEVLSTAETVNGSDDITSYVGSYAGQALALESTKGQISYTCSEHGWIIGLISVYPQSSYMQGLHRMWYRFDKYDFAWEQFALIGDDALLHKEVAFTYKDAEQSWNEGIFSYIDRYSEYRYHNDVISGGMRDYLTSFHLGRIFDPTNPTSLYLNDEFLQCKPRVTEVFQVAENENEIYAHIYNEVSVLRKLPKFGIPRI